MKVVAVDHVLEHGTAGGAAHDDLLHRAAPGRLPLAGPRPRRDPALPGRAAPALRPRLGPGAGRHRLVRARPVLRHVPHRLRAGHHPDGQGPGPAAQPAAHLRRVRPADVLPEVRAPALPAVPGDRAGGRRAGDHAGGRRPGGRAQRAARRGRRPHGRRRLPLLVLAGRRSAAPARPTTSATPTRQRGASAASVTRSAATRSAARSAGVSGLSGRSQGASGAPSGSARHCWQIRSTADRVDRQRAVARRCACRRKPSRPRCPARRTAR